jgi:hypothetical protein
MWNCPAILLLATDNHEPPEQDIFRLDGGVVKVKSLGIAAQFLPQVHKQGMIIPGLLSGRAS